MSPNNPAMANHNNMIISLPAWSITAKLLNLNLLNALMRFMILPTYCLIITLNRQNNLLKVSATKLSNTHCQC